MPFAETEVEGEWRGFGKPAPGLHGVGRTGSIHQKTRSLELSVAGKIDDGRIHATSQAEIVGMEQWWLAVVELKGLSTEAGRSAPDEGIQHRVCEHQYQGRGLEQR